MVDARFGNSGESGGATAEVVIVLLMLAWDICPCCNSFSIWNLTCIAMHKMFDGEDDKCLMYVSLYINGVTLV